MDDAFSFTHFEKYRDTESGSDVIIKIIPFGTIDDQFGEDTKSMAQHEDEVSYNVYTHFSFIS
jgi:hypothetical protein